MIRKIERLEICLGERRVGTLVPYETYRTAFQYDKDWLMDGYAINPLQLPLTEEVFIARYDPFEGLFGTFADSLPDGWGRLLVDRMLLMQGERPEQVGNLERLSIVGQSGMGAITYHPCMTEDQKEVIRDYDYLAAECGKILNEQYSDDLDALFKLGGSSGGARPKILTQYDGEDWIVKFPSSYDSRQIGEEEYRYSQCAKKCGIEMPETRLPESPRKSGRMPESC